MWPWLSLPVKHISYSHNLQISLDIQILWASLWPSGILFCVSMYEITALCKLNETNPNQNNSWPFSLWKIIFHLGEKEKNRKERFFRKLRVVLHYCTPYLRLFLLFCACNHAVPLGLESPYPGKPTECPLHLLLGWSCRVAPLWEGW